MEGVLARYQRKTRGLQSAPWMTYYDRWALDDFNIKPLLARDPTETMAVWNDDSYMKTTIIPIGIFLKYCEDRRKKGFIHRGPLYAPKKKAGG
jgi:hypothetical protein